ncbi:T9SS type B sorting domain-containing protein [Flavobacterium sp. IMCC34518]|uniref:T9SS type B sorting domain-containing protein n=1 Tax=Flavobacterium sp. IMCC34518 TaxID=3003623 RepID=UPI0024826AE9|nr:T9SS type B sorting domain-containing protein [Flavobacterium sp. IMCC34518]
MKKPTFSKLLFSVFFLFENFFQKNFIKTSFCKDFRNLKSPVFEKKSFFRIEYTATVFILAFFLMSSNGAFAQEGRKFLPRLSGGNIKVQGDVILIGNTVLNKVSSVNGNPNNGDPVQYSPAAPIDGVKYLGTVTNQAALTAEANLDNFAGGNNNNFFVEYIDLDTDLSTFNSTAATLFINQKCKKIVFAGLYWSAIYPYDRSTKYNKKYEGSLRDSDFNKIKFKTPTDAAYRDLVADEIIFDGYKYNGPNVSDSFKDSPYVCFKDVTSILDKLTDADGEYTVANVRASRGQRDGGGAGGWTLVVIYDTPTLPSKFVSVFDGYEGVNPDVGTPGYLPEVIFDVNGFRTLPPKFAVNAYIGVGALEGDQSAGGGDTFQILGKLNIPFPAPNPLTGFTEITDVLNPSKNFFNATVTRDGVAVTNRKPKSSNTLGFDIDYVKIPNTNNATLKNDEQGAYLKLTTTGDGYGAFVTTFAVDIIEPIVKLIKEVKNDKNVPIGNTNVKFGDVLFYEINWRNSGSDDVGDKDSHNNPVPFIIKDILPENINFDPATIDLSHAGGATLLSYDPATRTILFTMPISQLKQNSPEYQIRFKVQVVADCNELKNACINSIDNRAYVSYIGVYNNDKVFTDESLNSYGCVFVPQATNFLVGIDSCKFSQTMIYCGNDITLVARPGYENYVWSSSPTGVPVLKSGPDAFYTASASGTYYVFDNTTIFPCKSIVEQITVLDVKDFVNPAIDYVLDTKKGTIDACDINGEKLPKIFLCGLSDTALIKSNLSYNSTAKWEKLDETSCPIPVFPINKECANKNPSCKWNVVGTANDFLAKDAGYYKVTFSFTGGCSVVYYFNVYKNNLDPTAVTTDQFCTTPGSIKVKPAPLVGYEFSLDNAAYQDSPDFLNVALGTHNVKVRLKAAGVGSCEIPVKGPITISPFTMDVEVQNVKHPLCTGDLGSFRIQAKDVRPGYYFSATLNGTLVESVGPIGSVNGQNYYDFTGKAPGDYVVRTWTLDGCNDVRTVTINAPIGLKATAAVKPLTCNNGEINVTVQGGVSPYYYSVNNGPFLTSNLIPVVAPGGKYDIVVADSNGLGCKYTIPQITVNPNPKPIYTVVPTNILCYGSNTGAINFNVTSNTSGYTLAYSKDGGTTYSNDPLFSSLAPGTYTPVLKYSLSGVDCLDTKPAITITQPADALSASAGVSALAGCGDVLLGIPKNYGKVRITNPQGGVAPYEFSFDNQSTWTTTNDAYKAPGTYTLYVRDFNKKCIFSAPVTLDPEPAAPQIKVETPVDFNCDGSATSTVTIANPGGITYTYNYYLDGKANTPITNNVFTNVLPGSHPVKVEYKLNTVPTFSNLLFENFGYGEDAESPGINTTFYCWERQVVATQCKSSIKINDGDYSVTANIVDRYGPWVQPGDHTPQTVPATPKGRCLVVNLGDKIATTDVIYKKVINDIIPNQPINFELYAMNLLEKGNGQIDCNLAVALVDATGKEISTFTTGDIPKVNTTATLPIVKIWEKYPKTPITLDPKNNTSLTFIIRSNKIGTNGNDVAIDDIRVYQLPETCLSTQGFNVNVPTGKAFAAQISGKQNVTCNGLNNGEITIAAQNFDAIKGFEYSIDNGVTWSAAMTSSPVTIKTLAGALYKVVVRPVGSSIVACAKPFDVAISVPAALTLSTSVTKLATCTTGATITAVGGGGTPAYQYELRKADGVTLVPGFGYSNNGGVFTNVPVGNYTVFVKDANTCEIPVGKAVPVDAAPALTAALATTTDYCYTTANPATLDVTVSGGTGPFTYKLDANAAVSSAATTYSFTNVAPGTHTVLVTDSKNCDDTISSIVIAPQIGLTVSLINDLTCLVDATIDTPVVTNGNGGPYTYTVSHNGGAATAVTSFPYKATTHGTYVFTVTDSRGCPATSNTITVTAKTTPVASPSKTDITCNGLTDGTITITASAGFTSAYTYAIKLSTAPTYTTQITNKFTTLPAGTYDVKVIDSKGCESAVVQVTIANPTPIAANATVTTTFSCSPTNTKQAATITVAPTGGIGGYTYSYNNGTSFGNNNTLTVNDNGTIQSIKIIVKDANGCLSPMQQIDLAPLNPPTIATITNTPIYCAPAISTTSTVTVPVTAGTGVGTPTYTITSPVAATTNTTGAATGIFTGLTAGTYVFKVTDANGCFATKSHNVPALTPIAVTATKLTDVDCFGNTTGSIRYNVSGFSGTYSYSVNGATAVKGQTLTPFTLSNLGANTYSVVFTDEITGCKINPSTVISQPTAALNVTIVSNKNANCNVATARVEVLAAEGTPNYRYSFVTSATTPGVYGNSPIANLNPTTNTSWYAHVIDSKGCTFILPITIATDPTPTVTATAAGQCLGVGTFTITGNNTTPAAGIVTPITYSLNGGTFQSGNTFTVTASGDYIVRIKDGNGCIVPATAITVVPKLTLNAVLNKDITCVVGDEPAKITVTPNGGSGSFTYAITTPASEASNVTGVTTGVFTTSVPGNYTFTVTDATTGCTYTTTTAIPVTAKVDPDITVVNQTATINCNGDDTGAIKAIYNASLGLAPFQFSIDGTTFQNSDTFTGLSAGNYTVTIRDAKGCTDTEPITITEPTPITFVRTVTPITCNTVTGQSLGSITINSVTGGTPNYIYHVTGVNGLYDKKFTNQTGGIAVFDVVDFGLYQIIITDDNGCTAFENNILVASPPSDLDISVTPVGPTCAGLGSAEIAIGASPTAPTGPGPYHFAVYSPGLTYTGPTTLPWYDEDAVGSKKTTIPNLIPGVIYTFIVHDSVTGCYYFETSSIAIPTNSTITVSPLTPNNITCKGAADGNVTFTMNHTYGVATPVTYQIYNSQSVTPVGSVVATTIPAGGSLVISNFGTLPFGNYFVLVTETGTATHAGCSISSAPFDITESAIDLSITANIIKNSNCNDLGIITGQAKDGTAPYTYQVTTSATPPSASDANWVTGNTFTRAGSLAGTTYYVYAKDAYGCIKSDDVILLQDAPPTISVPTPICYNGTAFTINLVTDASATATILPATYSVNGSAFQSSPSFTFNAAGTYNLVIKDGNGCTATVPYEVYPKLELSAAVTKVPDCTLTPNAEITLTVTGGNTNPSANYTYEVSTTGGAPWTTMPTNVHSVAPVTVSTTFTFRVTDANNATICQTTTSIVLDPIPTTVFSTTETNVTCNGGSDGTITVNVTAGEGPYTFTLSGAGSNTTGDANGIYTGLPAGVTYVITVINAKNCPLASSPITIAAPSAITASAAVTTPLSCGTGNVTQQATVTVTASGGTGVLEYSFDGGFNYSTVSTYTTNIPGLVSVLVRDANGCPIAAAVTANVLPLNPPTNMDIAGTPIYCVQQGLGDVTSTVTISNPQNGIAPFTYQIISPIAAMIDNGTNAVFTGLAPDTYVFQITDNNGCTYQESYTVAPVTNITVAASATSNVTCFNAGDGTATFDVSNFGGTYNYTFDGAPFANVSTAQLTFTNLTPVLHTLIVTDAITGCQATATVTISQPAAALDFTATATKINCNNDNATITVVATGGTTAYKYAVVPTTAAAPVPTAYGLSNQLTVDTNSGANMVWDVYVMDANGCVDSDSVTILTDANPLITSANHTACVSATGTYDITVIATGFNQPTFQYSADGTNYQPSNVITVNAPGNYTIYVKDANGCPSAGFPITILDPLILTPTVTTPVSCANGDGVISVSTTGGSNILANYQYKIDSGSYPMTTPFTGLAFGTHRVYVQDIATGCEVFADIDLQQATPITGFALTKTDVTCNGGSDGTITATMTTPVAGVNDNPVYTYSLTGTTIGGLALTIPATGAPLQTSPIFTGLPASDVNGYTVVVTSARGCTATKTVVVAQPAPIVVPTIVPVPFGCTADNTGNLASITVTGVTGGSDNFLNYEFIKLGTPNTVVQFGASNMYTEANLSGGSYVVNVYDSKGCIGTSTTPIDIAPYIQLDKVNVNVTRPITCAPVTEDIAVSVSAIGGTPANLQFTVQDVTYDNSVPPIATKGTLYNVTLVSIVGGVATFTNLPVGNYEITVRNLDTNCEIIGVHYVNEPSTFDLTIDNIVDIKCFGGTNGSADIRLIDTVPSPVDDAGPFTYTLVDAFGISLPNGTSTAAGTVALTNLAAGTYTITATLTKTPFCTVSKNFTITGPSEPLVISEFHSDITCVTGNNDGSISATATGGWSGIYEYRLEETLSASVISDWSTTSSFNGLTAGNYVVKVRDPKGCEDFKTVQLVVPALITFTPIITNATLLCYGDTNASITIPLPIGGSGVYNYALEATYPNGTVTLDGPQPSNVFTNLGAASYKVIVTDTWTCFSVSNTLVITQPTVVTASLVQSSVQTCLSPATLTLSAVGGTGPYTYSADPNFATVLGSFASSTLITVPFTAVGINPLFYVRDVNGCSSTASNSVSVTPLEPLDFKFENDAPFINCLGDRNGQITAMAEGGSGNYIYTLLNSAGNLIVPSPTQPTPGFFTDLAAGSYLMEVKSGDCTSARKPITITEPSSKLRYTPKVTDVLCNGYANGKLEISATGGSPAIVYALSPELSKFVTTSNFENLEVGDYKAIIQDLKGCNYVYDFKIKEPNAIDAKVDVSVPIVQELCAGEKTGAFGIVITSGSGTAPYSTSIDNKNGIYVLNQVLFSGLSGGNHTVYIKDANSCTFELPVALDPSVILNPVATVSNECVNDLPANKVTVTIDPSNIPADVTYSLDAAGVEQNSNVFINLTPGDHYIMVHHKNGCDDATPVFPIDKIDPLAITIDLGGLNEIVATVTGGSSVYQFTVNGVSIGSNNKYIYFKSGNYTVTVTDSNGCVASATKYFEFIDIIIPPIFTPTGDGTNDSWKPTNTENYPDIKFVVYDRYGRVVGTFGAGQSWDGKYNGTELPMGDYWYVLKLRHNQDDREFMGHFTLYR